MELPIQAPDSGGVRRISYSIEAKNLSCTFCGRYSKLDDWLCFRKEARREPRFILKDVSCEAKGGELTAVAGPSGAGKTTLLEILAGIFSRNKVSGQVLVNGCPVHAQSFRKVSGYVAQEDALFPLLTVEETLMYSALLRLPGGKKEAIHRVRVLIKELGLEHVACSKIGEGSGSTRGISGGEKRRLSIGIELVHDPAVAFIDEPTSGLDSASALQVITLLKQMATRQGKTIILTIHQPGFRILELLDRLVLLSNGRVIHNGSLKLLEERLIFAGYRIPFGINVLEFAIDVAGSVFLQASETIHNDFFSTDTVQIKDRGFMRISARNNNTGKMCLSYSNTHFGEVLILGQRFCRNIFRTKQLFATRIIQALVAGFILGTIFMNVGNAQGQVALQTRLGFFAFSLTFLLSSTTEGLPIFQVC